MSSDPPSQSIARFPMPKSIIVQSVAAAVSYGRIVDRLVAKVTVPQTHARVPGRRRQPAPGLQRPALMGKSIKKYRSC